jgi:hypothetical protein
MTQPARDAALQRYHENFDSQPYNAIAEFLASNLYTERDNPRVIDGMVVLQDACFEVCGHPDHMGACHRLAVFCGVRLLSVNTVDAMTSYLRRFTPVEDVRIEDFRHTAWAMLRAQSGLDDLKTAAAYANGVHTWQGRMAYALLHAVEYLTLAAIHLLLRGDNSYIREKLRLGLGQVAGALHEGLFHADQPTLYDLSATRFPKKQR